LIVTTALDPEARRHALALQHPDPQQLWFQITEIFGERTYLQHGVRVAEDDVVFDVGANAGVAAVFFAGVARAKRVHSFEPVEPIFEILKRNTASYPACVPHMVALGARAGTSEITYYPRADAMSGLFADPARDAALVDRVMANKGVRKDARKRQLRGRYEGRTVACTVKTLSEVIREMAEPEIGLLKIDVERAELDVLRGLADDDWPRVRQLVAEVHNETNRRNEFEAALSSHGFRTTWVKPPIMAGTGVELVYAVRS
jgi:FkbM family methyltransferase